MNGSESINRPLLCPKSGQLLDALVTAFRLDDPAVGGAQSARHLNRAERPAKEYFAGDWVGDERRQEVCDWVADALLHSGVLGALELPAEAPEGFPSLRPMLAGTLYAWLFNWDAAFHTVAARWPHADQAMGGFILGRQAVIDLALRWAAATFLTREGLPHGDRPPWAERASGSAVLRRVLNQYLPSRGLDEYAKLFDVDPRTLDRWISQDEPVRPSEGNLVGIATALAKGDDGAQRRILTRLRREYGLCALWEELAASIGWKWATELGRGLVRLTRETLKVHGDEPPNQHFLVNQSLSFMNGAALPINALVLDDWLRAGQPPLWGDDILAARDGRLELRLTGCFRTIANWHAEPEPEWIATMGRTPEERRAVREHAVLWAMNDNRATPEVVRSLQARGHTVQRIPAPNDAVRISNRVQQAMVCMQHGDEEGSLEHWRRLIELEPANPRHRFFYGAALWQTQAPDFDGAVQQLQEACRLAPDWDRPFVEIAIIWLKRGVFDMALHHLHTQADRFRPNSDHFNWQEGVALRLLGRLDEALAAFERAVALNPDHGMAFDFAADCAYRLHDKVKGRRYAKKAYDLGFSESFRRWEP